MKRLLLTPAFLALLPSLAGAGHELTAPSPTVGVTVGSVTHQVWPYTYQAPEPFGSKSDPVNVVFGNADPREIRQALLGLNGNRTSNYPSYAPFNCVWIDAMGYDQAAWAEHDGWVGGAVQLACTDPKSPFGTPFRYHLRLFREGAITLGAAHFEFWIPNTASHEVLGWNAAADFVAFDMSRTGAVTSFGAAPMSFPTEFRTVKRAVYDSLFKGGAAGILAYAELPVPAPGSDPVPMPLDPTAYVIGTNIPLKPVQARAQTPLRLTWDIVVPKPFCAGPSDYVKLEGPMDFSLVVHTNPSGMFSRVYSLSGTLKVTPLAPNAEGKLLPSGPVTSAVISEAHRALLTDEYQQVTEEAGQTLLDPLQSLSWSLRMGQQDGIAIGLSCTP